jgi:NADH-quinone oxidoreductase subunit F
MVLDQHDAVFLALGAQRSAGLGIKGEGMAGVHGALEFLRKVNSAESIHEGDHVIVIGGGNSAIDAARTARRLGAKDVQIIYRRQIQDMPAQREEIHSAEEEGIAIHPLVSPVELAGSDGAVKEVICQRMGLGDFDSSGRRRPVPILNNNFSLEADQVLIAIGQSTDLPFKSGNKAGVQVSKEGLIRIKEGTYACTNNPRIFAGGDVVTGPATVVLAIAAGHRAATEIHQAISGRKEDLSVALTFGDKIDIPMKVDEETVEWPQEHMNILDIKDRVSTFLEVDKGYAAEQALKESCRCLRCDIREEDEVEEGASETDTANIL